MQRSDAGWSAIAAGVLALVIGSVGALLVVLGGLGLAEDGELDPVGVVVFVSAAVVTVLLLGGAVLLLARRPAGRGMLAAGSSLSIAGVLYVLVRSSEVADDPRITWSSAATDLDQLKALGAGALVVLTVVLCLVLLPATGRWCARGLPVSRSR